MRSIYNYIALLTLLVLASCTNKPEPISSAEALQFAKQVEHAAATQNAKFLNNIFNEDEFASRTAKAWGKIFSTELKKGVIQGLHKSPIGSQILAAMDSGDGYQMVKQYEKDNIQHLIFRMHGDGGINYHDYELIKMDNKVKVADMYVYITGENLSKTIADIGKLADGDEKVIQLAKKIKEVQTLTAAGSYEEARTTFLTISAGARENKVVQTLDIETCVNINDTANLNVAIRKFKESFPNDPCIYLVMLNGDFLNKNYQKALRDVDNLDQLINKDPFLDYYRALIHKMDQQLDSVQTCLERLTINMPDYDKGFVELAVNDLRLEKPEKAKEVADIYKKKFPGKSLSWLAAVYPEYRQYLE